MTNTTTFHDLGVPATLASVLAQEGKTTAFPIQVATLPDTLNGRDVLARGKTGSGKTLAFSIPMVSRLVSDKSDLGKHARRPRGLVLCPTRELATQIARVLEPLADSCHLATATVFGGVSHKPQSAAFQAGVDIVVACPGRLEDLINQGVVSLDEIEIVVLDEADHMADLGFLPAVTRIMNAVPIGGQRMLFSATLDNGVDTLVRRYLHDEIRHSIDDAQSPIPEMTHHVFEVDGVASKSALVRHLASGLGRRILFTRTKHHAKRLARALTEEGIPAVDLHGNLSQGARDRNLASFGSGDISVLVATDVAARGVHVDHVELVVHVDPPAEHKAYLHRSGRTARAGSDGDVVTVVLPGERRDVATLLRKANIRVTPQTITATSPVVTALVGQRADYVKPEPRSAPGRAGSAAASSNRNRRRSEKLGAGRSTSRRRRTSTGYRTGGSRNKFGRGANSR